MYYAFIVIVNIPVLSNCNDRMLRNYKQVESLFIDISVDMLSLTCIRVIYFC